MLCGLTILLYFSPFHLDLVTEIEGIRWFFLKNYVICICTIFEDTLIPASFHSEQKDALDGGDLQDPEVHGECQTNTLNH